MDAAARQRRNYRDVVAGKRPSNDEIAEYAVEFVTCHTCGTKPGYRCAVVSGTPGRTVCKGRFHDAAVIFVPQWKRERRALAALGQTLF